MGLVTTVKNKNSGNVYTISTLARDREMRLPGANGGPEHVISESAVYFGRPRPLSVMTGRKPAFAVYNSLAGGEQFSAETFHGLLVRTCEKANFGSANDFCAALRKKRIRAYQETHAQLLYGFRKIEFIFTYGKG